MTFPSSTAWGGPRRRNRVPSMKQQKQPKSAPPNRGSTQAGTCGQRSVVGRTSRPGGLRVPAPCGDDYEASNVRSNSDNDVEGSPAGQRQRGVGGPGGEIKPGTLGRGKRRQPWPGRARGGGVAGGSAVWWRAEEKQKGKKPEGTRC